MNAPAKPAHLEPLVDRRPGSTLSKDQILDAADHLEHAARQDRPFTPYEKTRLHLAGQIAAGLCANPHVFEMRGWQGEVARDSLSMADKILLVHLTGGC